MDLETEIRRMAGPAIMYDNIMGANESYDEPIEDLDSFEGVLRAMARRLPEEKKEEVLRKDTETYRDLYKMAVWAEMYDDASSFFQKAKSFLLSWLFIRFPDDGTGV